MFTPDLLKEKIILITGGGTGLGKSMATHFNSLGAKVVIASRKQEVLDEAVEEIKHSSNPYVAGISCDVRKPVQISSLLDKVEGMWGPVNILVNNAAGNFICPTENLTPGGFKIIVDIVLNGTFNMTHAVGKQMIQNEGGTILNIVTTYAWTGSGYVVPSAAAKAGVLAMTRSLAVEWAQYGIRSNAIAPGPFPTKGAWDRLVPPGFELEESMKQRIPLKRFGKHIELSNLAAFLISDYASFINGDVITIDGGEWLKGAGEFNDLDKLPHEVWESLSVRHKNEQT